MTIAARVKARREELAMTQSELATKAGTTQQSIQQLEDGEVRRPRYLIELAAALKCDAEYLLHGKGSQNFSYAGPEKEGASYPLISWISAGSWVEAVEPYSIESVEQWFKSDEHIEGRGFWLKVDGDSMTAPTGLSIPSGTLVLFDTGRDAKNGSLVIAKLDDSNEVTFKKLIIDGGKKYLKGLNPVWPPIEVNGNCTIIGVAIETKLRLV